MKYRKLYIIIYLITNITGEIWSQNACINQIINNLYNDSVVKADLVLNFINTIHDKNELGKDSAKYGAIPPPVPGVLYYDRNDFIELYKNNLIPKEDIDFMYNQINKHRKIKLDSKKIGKDLLNANVFSEYRDKNSNDSNDFFSYLKSRYNSESYIIFSNALFSKNQKKCLIGFREYYKSGSKGKVYLLYLVDDFWKVYNVIEELNNY